MTESRWDVLGLGCVAVDDLLLAPEYPAPDSKVRLLARRRSCGGLTATALIAAARLGARAAFAGILGDDEDSRFVRDSFQRDGVDVSCVVRRADARPIHSTIIVDQTQHTRTILYDLAGSTGAAADAPSEEVIRAARVLFVDHYGIEGMTRAARIARQSGIAVVADFERHEWPGFHDLLALVDHLVLSESFAHRLTGAASATEAIDRLWSDQRQVVAVTCGENGCWYRSREADAVRQQAAFAVPVVDTTGCGDVFHGAYALGLAEAMSPLVAARFASAAAAAKAERGMGWDGMPDRALVERMLLQENDA